MPGFSAGHVELHVQVGEDHLLLDRSAHAIGQSHKRIDDEPLEASIGYADSNLNCVRGADVVAAPNQRAVMRSDTEVATVSPEVPADGREGVPLPDVSVGRGLGVVAHLSSKSQRKDAEYNCHERSMTTGLHQSHTLKSRPVISPGCSTPSKPRTVG